MIGVNILRRPVLITTDEVIFHAPVNNDPDVRSILNSIIVAEVRFIKPLIGHTIYNALIENKNLLVTIANKAGLQTAVNAGRAPDREQIVLNTGDYVNSDTYLTTEQLDLWQNYLHKIIAECVWFSAMPVNRTRFSNQGVEQNNPQSAVSDRGSASASLADFKHLLDAGMQHRINPLIEDLHEHLCRIRYPGYHRDCGRDSKGNQVKKRSDIVLSLYDTKPNRRDRGCCDEPVSTSSYVSSPINETIPFADVSFLLIPWTVTRKNKYGASGVFTVEILGDDNLYHVTAVEVVADNDDNTTYYRIDFTGPSTGRVTLA